MTTYLSLPNASIARLKGWGRSAKPDDYDHRIELTDIGLLVVYGTPVLREKRLLSMSIEHLEITAGTEQHTTPGGYRATSSLADMLLGGTQPRRLKPVAGKTTEYTILRTQVTLPNGTRREADFAFRSLDESDLRDQLTSALHPWADAYVKATLTDLTAGPAAQPPLQSTYDQVDRMQQRGLLTPTQALVLRSHASQPFIDTVLHRLRAGNITHPEAEALSSEIADLQQRGRVNEPQAREVRNHLARILSPPPPPKTNSAERLQQVQALAELRRIGALTETEFQSEKARVLDENT